MRDGHDDCDDDFGIPLSPVTAVTVTPTFFQPKPQGRGWAGRKPCFNRINESAVLTLVSDMLRAIAEYSRNDRAEFIKAVQETQAEQQVSDINRKRKQLAAAQKRAGELEKLICKIYEDNVLGKLHQAYLRRKANGTQKRYEEKIKAKKKAEIEAKKAAIHAEDMEKGVFIPAGSLPKKEPQKAPMPARAAM